MVLRHGSCELPIGLRPWVVHLHTLLVSLDLKDQVNWDYFILLVAKTGMRFSEALALTPKDFDFSHQTLSISKTWNYKGDGGFQPTKNRAGKKFTGGSADLRKNKGVQFNGK